MKLRLRATGCHLPYGITQCYLPPDIGDQFIEPYGFSGSLPLLFVMFWLLFVLIAENKLLVGWIQVNRAHLNPRGIISNHVGRPFFYLYAVNCNGKIMQKYTLYLIN